MFVLHVLGYYSITSEWTFGIGPNNRVTPCGAGWVSAVYFR